MPHQSLMPRILVVHARSEAFVPSAVHILSRLGYQLLSPEDFEEQGEDRQADLRIVDERRLGEVVDEPGEKPTPIIALTGRHGVTGADPRIVGAVVRPAGLHDLYRLIQQVFEETPRSTPRVSTHLRAFCRRKGREWDGAVLSLSDNGCLLRSTENVPLGSRLELRFELPRVGALEVRAETAYQLLPDLGLVFSAIPASTRAAIASYVTRTLASG